MAAGRREEHGDSAAYALATVVAAHWGHKAAAARARDIGVHQAFSQRLAPLVKRVVSPLQAPPEANPADQARGQEGPGRQAVAASLVAPRGNEREKFFSGFFLDEFSFDFWFKKKKKMCGPAGTTWSKQLKY
jgi:hypothetical protein